MDYPTGWKVQTTYKRSQKMSDHENHKRKGKPLANCATCWHEYMRENPDALITAMDMLRLLDALQQKTNQWKIDMMWRKDPLW